MDTTRTQPSPQIYARAAGLLYLLVILLGGFAYGYVPGRLVTDAAVTTASNILSHEFLWRLGIVAALVTVVCALPQLLFEYLLLRPVQRDVMRLAVFFNLLSLTVESLGNLGHFAALYILKAPDLPALQAQAWAVLAIDLHDTTLDISFLFFGATCLLYGYLIFRSRFLPRFLGLLMALAGVCYSLDSLLDFLHLQLGPAGFPWLLFPAGLSELTLCLWLLIMGVNVPKWREWVA